MFCSHKRRRNSTVGSLPKVVVELTRAHPIKLKSLPRRLNKWIDPVVLTEDEASSKMAITPVKTRGSPFLSYSRSSSNEERKLFLDADRFLRSFQHNVESLLKTLYVARKIKDPWFFDLYNPRENDQFQMIREILKKLAAIFNRFWEAKNFEDGQDYILDLLKTIGTNARNSWQWNQSAQEIRGRDIKAITLPLYSYLELCDAEGVGYTRIIFPFKKVRQEFWINSFAINMIGNINRSLSTCSNRKLSLEIDNVYNRFRNPRESSAEIRREFSEWCVAALSESLSKEDFNKYFQSDIRGKTVITSSACFERNRAQGGVVGLIHDYYSLYNHPILPEEEMIRYNSEFAKWISVKVLKPFLNHATECPGPRTCPSPGLHLPIIPIGIKESGGRTRIPCMTSGLLNIIVEPIRRKIFRYIMRDNRTRYRYTGKAESLKTFIRRMKEEDFFHSSDLKTSTDFLPFRVTKALWEELRANDLITKTEYQALLCATQSLRMVPPNEKGAPWLNIPALKQLKMTLQTGSISAEAEILSREREGGAINKLWKKLLKDYKERYPEGQPLPKGLSKLDWQFDKQYVLPTQEQVLNALIQDHRGVLSCQVEKQYLTESGLHMATSISIAILNLINLFADTYAETSSGLKAISILCGDDAFRAGKKGNLRKYREILWDLGMIFSDTKDIETSFPRGVFTEILIEDGKELQVPKPKFLTRTQQKGEAPAWLSAIGVLQGLKKQYLDPITRDNCEFLIKERFQKEWERSGVKEVINDLLVVEQEYPGEISDICRKIISVADPYEALVLFHEYTSQLRVRSHSSQEGNRARIKIPYLKYIKVNEENWNPNNALWLPLALRKLRGINEAAYSLKNPKWHIGFEQASPVYTSVHQRTINADIEKELIGKTSHPRTPSTFRKEVMRQDIDMSLLLAPDLLFEEDLPLFLDE